ncbi:MAG TPA: hypothetical protein VII13_04175 [Vicinamibacteria bacterium]|jgi:hypothetical protein
MKRTHASFVLGAGIILWSCGGGGELAPSRAPAPLAATGEEDSANAQGVEKVTICHVPPGNPENAHTITVGSPAVPAHMAHGDSEGACTEPSPSPSPEPSPET